MMRSRFAPVYTIVVIVALIVLLSIEAFSLFKIREENGKRFMTAVPAIQEVVRKTHLRENGFSKIAFSERIRQLFLNDARLAMLVLSSSEGKILYRYQDEKSPTLTSGNPASSLPLLYRYNPLFTTRVSRELPLTDQSGAQIDLFYQVLNNRDLAPFLKLTLAGVVFLFILTVLALIIIARNRVPRIKRGASLPMGGSEATPPPVPPPSYPPPPPLTVNEPLEGESPSPKAWEHDEEEEESEKPSIHRDQEDDHLFDDDFTSQDTSNESSLFGESLLETTSTPEFQKEAFTEPPPSEDLSASSNDKESPMSKDPPPSSLEGEEEKSESSERGLYSPRSGLGWGEFLEDRLSMELDRATSFEQDLSLVLIQMKTESESTSQETFTNAIHATFPYKDLSFEYGDTGAALILPNTPLHEALSKVEQFMGGLTPETMRSTFAGVTSRNDRLISGTRFKGEAEAALSQTHPGKTIVGFKADPEKFRAYLKKTLG